jgi:hypothetical protein
MSASTEPHGGAKAFNPTWLAVGILSVTQLVGIGMAAQTNADTRVRVSAIEAWQTATERRLAEGERIQAVTTKGFEKDLASLQTGVNNLQQSLTVLGATISSNPRTAKSYP